MKVELICSESIKPILKEVLSARNIDVTEKSDACIVEKGYEVPFGHVGIMFELEHMDKLLTFLDQFLKVPEERLNSIVGKYDDEKYEIIPFDKICYFETRSNITFCITEISEYRVKEKLYELEEKLPNSSFIRVNKSSIVNISSVKQIIPWFDRRLILRFDNSREVEVARRQVKKFKEFLGM